MSAPLGPPPAEPPEAQPSATPVAPEVAPQEQQGPVLDYQAIDLSMDVRDRFDDAAEAGDWETADHNFDRMKEMAGTATLQVLGRGGDPSRETSSIGMFLHPQIEMVRRQMAFQGRQDALKGLLQNDPELGLVKDYMKGVFEEYKTKNEQGIEAWNPSIMTPEQKFDYQMKLQPVQRDPNEVADMRQMLVSVDGRMKDIDESFSVFTHPATRQWAGWMMREAGDTGLGYLQSGQQELEMGALGRAGYVLGEVAEAITDPVLSAGYQMWEWMDQGLRGMGMPSVSPPRNYIEGPDGKVYFNQERLHPGLLEATQALWSRGIGEDVTRSVGKLNRDRYMERAQRAGWTNILHGASNVAGVFLGFGLPAGASMTRGSQAFAYSSKKGLSFLAGLGVKGAASPRALALTEVWGGRMGAAMGLGAFQATAFGKHGGYMSEFATGMAMAPVLAVLGHYGPRLERVLAQRAHIPRKVSSMLSEGMVMGVPFAALEWAEMGLWEHLRNPNESTADIFLKNILGAMLFKGAFGKAQPTMQEQAMVAARFHVERSQARAKFAEDVAEGREDFSKTEGKFEGKITDADVVRLGEIIKKKKETTDLAERQRLDAEQRELEQELDIKEYGLEQKVEKELEQISMEEEAGVPEKVQKEFKPRFKEKMDDLKKLPQEKKVDVIIDRLLGPKGYATSKEAAEAKKAEEAAEARPTEALELGSIKAGDMPIEAVKGVEQSTLDDVFSEMEGRIPRKGFRIPFTARRLGGKPGDPVRPAFRKGRIGGGKGVLGLYKIFENLVRTRAGKDLVTATHEWSHAMQRSMQADRGGKQFTDAAKEWVKSLPPELIAEFPTVLKGYANWEKLSLPRKGMEVWAEWHARELLSDTTLDTQAPALSAHFRAQMARPENAAIREQFMRIQSSILRYQQIGARGRLRASIIGTGEPLSEGMRATRPTRYEQARDKILQNWFDDITVLKRGTDKWLEATGIDPAEIGIMEDPGRLWDALRMTAGKQAEHFVMRGITMPDGTHVEGMRKVLSTVEGRQMEFRDYLVAVLNAQRIKRGKRATLSMSDYVSEIRRLQTENPDFRQAARDLKAWTDTIVDWIAGAGNLAPEQAQKIKDAYVLWVPFFRMMEGPSVHGGGTGRKIAPVGEGVGKVRGGGKERIRDPLQAMFESVTQMISNAHRNMVVSAFYKMAVGHEAGGLATKIKKTVQPKDHPLAEILDAIERQVELPGEGQFHLEDMVSALRDADALDAQTVTLFAQKVTVSGENNVLAFTPRLTEAEIARTARGDEILEQIIRNDQGKNLWLEFDPAIYETLVGLDVPPMNKFFENSLLGQFFRMSSNLRRLFATGLAPGFVAANIMRDAMSQPMFSQEGTFAPGGGFVRMIKGAIDYHADKGPGGIRDLYETMGVRISSFYHEGTRQKIMGESRGILQKSREAIEHLEQIFSTPENYLRIHEFKQIYEKALAEGKTEIESRMLALEAGREITVNFARGGIYARFVNGMTPYFNASLQGQRKLWRQIVHGGDGKNDVERARIQRSAFLNGVANITVPSMALWWMNHEEEWYQDLPEWRKLLFFNMKISDDFMLSLPKPFEAGVLFGGIPETFMDMWVSENGRPPALGTVLVDGLFPYLKGPGDFLPALIQPIIEMTADFDFFRRRPLTPGWIESNRIREEQSTFYTSETAKILSRALNGAATPIQVEKILGGYTSGAGTYALRALDEITGLKDHPGFSMNPLKRFFTQPHRGGFHQNRMYEIGKELDRLAGSRQASGEELALRGQINQVKERFSEISRAVQSGAMDSNEAERLKFEMARPLVERYEAIR